MHLSASDGGVFFPLENPGCVLMPEGLAMRKLLFIAVFAVLCPAHARAPGASGRAHPCVQAISPLAQADTLLVKQQYQAAKTYLADYLKNAPDDNEALYLRVAVDQTEILDYESYSIQNAQFTKTADSIRTVLEGRLAKLHGKDSVRCLFYIANIYGGLGVIMGKTGEWFPSVKSSMTSITMLKEVLRLDSTVIAASLGVGIFHYYLSKSFKWLPFIDERSEEEGIRNVERATRAPFPFGFAAKNSLCWILIEHQEYRRADSIALSVLAEAPDNTIFLRIRCLIALWDKRFDDAVALGKRLAQLSNARSPVNWSDLVLAHYVMSSGNDALGREKEAVAAADYILNAPMPPKVQDIPPIKRNLKKIQAIRKKYKAL